MLVDGAITHVEEKFRQGGLGPDDRLTDEEVQAIVKRYGESQAGGDIRPTVSDVAEALHVEPSVVARLLSDIRSAESSKDLMVRLESLEQENAELRQRADRSESAVMAFDNFYGWRGRVRRRPRSFAATVCCFIGFIFLINLLARGSMGGGMAVAALIPALVILFIAFRLLFRR